MAASNGNKYIVDDSVETGKEKEMLMGGDMLLSIIPRPWSTACDFRVPFCEEGEKRAQISADGPVLPLPPSPQPASAAWNRGFSVFALEGGNRADAECAEQTPWSSSIYLLPSPPASPRASLTSVQIETWAGINVA